MAKKFDMSMMGKLTFILGWQVKQITNGIFVCQNKSIANMLKKYGFSDCEPVKTPMSSSTSIGTDPSGIDVNATLFQGTIGSIIYLIVSRPYIMFATILCARYQASPKESHLHNVKRIFQYLKHTPNLRLWYPRDSDFNMVGYTESDHGGCGIDRKRTLGGAQMLGNRLIGKLVQKKKHTSMSCSTAEVEYVAARR
ncbi:uncharacterized protein LOC111885462 [Lactuca sativa]|uniref:uncharacterized protein LOC111885462 n=1 Tax=Lactuca sativa TaxID=4236 RepID=UPI000CD8B346|nr:uncharacterized protein LOC111885462 [Lactuca sativa]